MLPQNLRQAYIREQVKTWSKYTTSRGARRTGCVVIGFGFGWAELDGLEVGQLTGLHHRGCCRHPRHLLEAIQLRSRSRFLSRQACGSRPTAAGRRVWGRCILRPGRLLRMRTCGKDPPQDCACDRVDG